MRISDWSSDVCSSDLGRRPLLLGDLRTVCVRATRPLTLEQTLAPQPHEDRHRRRVRQAPGCTERIMDVSRCERSAVSPEDASSELDIVYPQLGGLTDSAASMMVVVRHRTLVGDEERTVTRTVDVRLEKGADGWTVSELAATGGEPPVSPAVTPPGQPALANPNPDLPAPARRHIASGRISHPTPA